MKTVHVLSVFVILILNLTLSGLIDSETFAQNPDSNQYWYLHQYYQDANYYPIREMGWNYYNTHPELDTLKGTGFKDVQSIKFFSIFIRHSFDKCCGKRRCIDGCVNT
ncbi:MAG: hypothetical protein KBC43_02095 [Bacteroidales bacterium]|nr:hypothetical protein [Bacteroidales bacterium]